MAKMEFNGEFDVEITADVKFKQAPDFNAEMKQKAVAGVSEEDLIKRHTIGKLEEDEDEEDTVEDTGV